jgi:hypothetical protein
MISSTRPHEKSIWLNEPRSLFNYTDGLFSARTPEEQMQRLQAKGEKGKELRRDAYDLLLEVLEETIKRAFDGSVRTQTKARCGGHFL